MASRVLLALLVVSVAGLPAQPVRAQGFFEQLFGDRRLPPPAPRPYYGYGRPAPYQSYSDGYENRGGTVRTLCVRLCDGYYFPISFSTLRSELTHDAEKCSASCGSEARLFYHANPGGDVETMVDLAGMGYATLPNAFRYRKALVDGCSCRPQPWSEAKLARHRAYARERLASRPERATGVPGSRADDLGARPADDAPDRQISAFDEPLAVVRPDAISRYVLPSLPQSRIGGAAPANGIFLRRGSSGGYYR